MNVETGKSPVWSLFAVMAVIFAGILLVFVFVLPAAQEPDELLRTSVDYSDLGLAPATSTVEPVRAAPADAGAVADDSATRRRRRAAASRSASDEPKPTTLGPDDIIAMYKRNSFRLNRCYERALKQNPNLKLRKAAVTVSVDRAGRASAEIPSVKNAVLRGCLARTISGWRFPPPGERIRAEITMIFAKQ